MKKRKLEEKRDWIWKIAGILAPIVLALYPLRHIFIGLDLWDTGYNYANFEYMGTEHMDPMWLFSTYLSNVMGHFFTILPFGKTLVGLNFYTGLFVSAMALIGFFFATRELKFGKAVTFLGEFIAISLCWCPTALLYNYLTYFFFLLAVIFLYKGLSKERVGFLVAAGAFLGANVLVRFPNIVECAMIVGVWAYDFLVWRERKEEGFWKRTLKHTGACLAGYLGILLILFGWIGVRYGLDSYIDGITKLFAMTDTATDYKATSMLRAVFGTYLENLYWLVRILIVAALGVACFAMVEFVKAANKGLTLEKPVHVLETILGVALGLALLVWLYGRAFCSFAFYSYDSMLRPGILFLMLILMIALIRLLAPGASLSEKLISGLVILLIFITSLGSNNGVMPSMNNLFLAAPFCFYECAEFWKKVGAKKIGKLTFHPLPVKCVMTAFLLLCTVQFAGFGWKFVFAEATGVQEAETKVQNNAVLTGVKMSEEKAEWMTQISDFVSENDLDGKEVILYGNLPALSFYLQMPSAFNPWSVLDSYSVSSMEKAMAALADAKETPVIMLENTYACVYEEGESGLAALDLVPAKKEKIVSDLKFKCLAEFMKEYGYALEFENEKVSIYLP